MSARTNAQIAAQVAASAPTNEQLEAGFDAYMRTRFTQMKAALVECCEAGKVAYPDPCPWHGAGAMETEASNTERGTEMLNTIATVKPGDIIDKRTVARTEHCTADYANVHLHIQGDGTAPVWCISKATEIQAVGSRQFVTVKER